MKRFLMLSRRCWSWIVFVVLTSAVVILDYTNAAADPIHEVVLPSGYTRVTLPPLHGGTGTSPKGINNEGPNRRAQKSWSPYVAVIWNPGLRPVLLDERERPRRTR